MALDPILEGESNYANLTEPLTEKCLDDSLPTYAEYIAVFAGGKGKGKGTKKPAEKPTPTPWPNGTPPTDCKSLKDIVDKKFEEFLKKQFPGSINPLQEGEYWFKFWLQVVCSIESTTCSDCDSLRPIGTSPPASGSDERALGCYQLTGGFIDDVVLQICSAMNNPKLRELYGLPTAREACNIITALRNKIKAEGKISKDDSILLIKLWLLRYQELIGDPPGPGLQRKPGESVDDWMKRIYRKYGDPANAEEKWDEKRPGWGPYNPTLTPPPPPPPPPTGSSSPN